MFSSIGSAIREFDKLPILTHGALYDISKEGKDDFYVCFLYVPDYEYKNKVFRKKLSFLLGGALNESINADDAKNFMFSEIINQHDIKYKEWVYSASWQSK